MNLFRSGDGYVIALTYGRDRDWVNNVVAAGGCKVETRGRTLYVTDPRIVRNDERTLIPLPIRPILRAFGVNEFLELRRSGRA